MKESVTSLRYGELKAFSRVDEIRTDHVAGFASYYESYQIEKDTDEIPLFLNQQFGIIYQINKLDGFEGKYARLREVITFPKGGLTNPANSETMRYVEFNDEVELGASKLLGYMLSEEWELKSGSWIFEVYFEDELLIRKAFNVKNSSTMQ